MKSSKEEGGEGKDGRKRWERETAALTFRTSSSSMLTMFRASTIWKVWEHKRGRQLYGRKHEPREEERGKSTHLADTGDIPCLESRRSRNYAKSSDDFLDSERRHPRRG
jgi:hypothetical protein